MSQEYKQFDLSGGAQAATSFLMKKQNEVHNLRNGRFGVELGAITRRNGSIHAGSTFGTTDEKAPTGGKIVKFSTGNVRFVAVNNSTGTATIVRTQNSGTGAWTTLTGLPSIPPDAEIFFFMWLDEVYVTGYDPATGDPITPFNVNSSLNVSTTRNIAHMPACRYIAEFNGALYAANVKIGSTRYRDRVYKSSGPLGAVTFIQGDQLNNFGYFVVDSVRYIKVGDAFDIYDAGTNTKLYDITVTAVDIALRRVYFTPVASTNMSAINTTTETITVGSTANYPTGTPVRWTTTGTLPGGLTVDTVYYVINVSGTTVRMATTLANALAGTPLVDLTSSGSGTHTMNYQYNVSDNDEVWLDGRKGQLTVFWNTDRPTPENADWTATRPGTGSSNEITGIAKSSNRLFLFTKYSAQKFDGNVVMTFNNSIGCISQRSLANIDDDWLIWVDAKGRIHARNESAAQQEYISRGIKNTVMKYITMDNLAASSGAVNDNTYYLDLGQNETDKGLEWLRVVYSFDDNVWSIDRLQGPARFADNDDYTGEDKLYFFSNDGYLSMDDTGNEDNGKSIPLEINFGRDNFGSQKLKKYEGIFVYSENSAGATIKVSVDGKQSQSVGRITEESDYIEYNQRDDSRLERGTSCDVDYFSAGKGDPEIVRGIVQYFTVEEDSPSVRRPR